MADGGVNPLPIGTIVHQRYRITAVVGRGGLGTVYQVVDVLFGKSNVFALKELIDQSSGARKQFENESQWLHSLDHNSIPKVREHFDWQGRLYLVMDFVDGENLEQRLARNGGRPLPEGEVLHWILPICDALHYLHTRNPPILHRDVKPANIIVTPAGHPVLVDLGIAKEHLPGAGQTATFVRKAGTEGYAPPEQYAAAGQTGPWSDVYGVGATLYQLLTGRVPPTAVERVALDARLPAARAINPEVSPQVDAALAQALALRPAERFQSARELARALSADAASPRATPSAPSAPSRPPQRQGASPPSNTGMADAASYTSRQFQHPGTRPFPSPAFPASNPAPAPALRAAALTPPGMVDSHPGSQTGDLRSGPDRVRDSTTLGRLSAPAPRSPSTRDGERVYGSNGGRRPFYRSPLVLGGGLAALVLLGVVVAVLALNATAPPDRSSPRATVTGYFAALKAENYSLAWQFVAQSRTNVSVEASFVSNLQSDDARLGHVLTAQVTALDTSSGQVSAQVDVTRAMSPSVTLSYSVDLTQFDNDTWLITSISSTS